MTIRFDEKGKFFTDVVSKETIPVVLQTTTHRIMGRIHIRPGQRLKDAINTGEPFFAVTEARVFSRSGEEVYTCDFMAVNRDHIIWLIPNDQMHDPSQTPRSEM